MRVYNRRRKKVFSSFYFYVFFQVLTQHLLTLFCSWLSSVFQKKKSPQNFFASHFHLPTHKQQWQKKIKATTIATNNTTMRSGAFHWFWHVCAWVGSARCVCVLTSLCFRLTYKKRFAKNSPRISETFLMWRMFFVVCACACVPWVWICVND